MRNPQVTAIRKQLRALRRRAASSTEQCRHYANLTEVYANAVTRDLDAIQGLEVQLAILQAKVVN